MKNLAHQEEQLLDMWLGIWSYDVSCGRGNYVPHTRIQRRAKREEIVTE